MSDLAYAGPRYRLELAPDGTLATLSGPGGERWADLRPLAALDPLGAADETVEIMPPRREGDSFVVERRSTAWERAWTRLTCTDEALVVGTGVRGRGKLADAHLLAYRSLLPGGKAPLGYLPSGHRFRSLFSPNPGDPLRIVRSPAESAVLGVLGDGAPGRGHWLFSPAPLLFALTTAETRDPDEPGDAGWLGLGIAAPVEELGFVQASWVPGDGSFALVLEYEGHTEVEGEWGAPLLVLAPGHADPYAAIAHHRADLVARGHAPAPRPRETPAWWSEPIFCGWGAQCHLAGSSVQVAPELATQASYDGFLAVLAEHDVRPGTVVLDDKWQAAYATNEPDEAKWPDLRDWIAGRHEAGQRVLLWWKAWDPEGLPPELTVRNPEGEAVAFDPTHPQARALLRGAIGRMLAPDGLDADGLKIDFTARTPSGRGLEAHGAGWGIALLHDLLALVYGAAKEAKPDALVITHTPHPAFVDVTDMVRLNDMLRTDDPGPRGRVTAQMRFRARVVAAACPELLVDTDDWCVPNLEEWREYAEAKIELGVPSLYYAQAVDATGEPFEERDYETVRRTWAAWRAGR